MRASAALRVESVVVDSGVPPLNSIHEPKIKIWDDARLKIVADMEKIGKGRRRAESPSTCEIGVNGRAVARTQG